MFSNVMTLAPFESLVSPGGGASKKDLRPRKDPYRYLWDKSLETSAVPPKLAVKEPPARRRANTRLSLVTGEKPVGIYLGNPVRPALRGPFNRLVSAAISPPAALFENQGPAYSSASSVCACELGHRIRLPGRFCQEVKFISTDSTI